MQINNRADEFNSLYNKKGVDMLFIVLMLIIFYPVGMALMISKLHKEKFNYRENAKASSIIGWIFTGIGIFMFFIIMVALLEDPNLYEDLIYVIIGAIMFISPSLVPGIILIMEGSKYKRLGNKFQRYYTIVYENEESYLDKISGTLNISYDIVVRDLQELISKKIFMGCYIDSNLRKIVFPNERAMSNFTVGSRILENNAPSSIICKSCGGVNPLTAKECEYCGTSI
ncbi:hypothetical protein LJC13_02105 [Peptostreptococcaceae bacterium OttesenSCG-928-C18]|nr:hypothetical protein [Peptostreptococcaceae bacterium OttesenSCG-928-C18]